MKYHNVTITMVGNIKVYRPSCYGKGKPRMHLVTYQPHLITCKKCLKLMKQSTSSKVIIDVVKAKCKEIADRSLCHPKDLE